MIKQWSEPYHSSQGVWQVGAAEWLGQKALAGLQGLSLSCSPTHALMPFSHRYFFPVHSLDVNFQPTASQPTQVKWRDGPSLPFLWPLKSPLSSWGSWEGPVKWAGTDTLNSSRAPGGAILTLTPHDPPGGSEPSAFPLPLARVPF